jgi:hypothetical protein
MILSEFLSQKGSSRFLEYIGVSDGVERYYGDELCSHERIYADERGCNRARIWPFQKRFETGRACARLS